MCSCCGVVKAALDLSQRTFHCDECGFVCDRDVNAALNLEKKRRKHFDDEVGRCWRSLWSGALWPTPQAACETIRDEADTGHQGCVGGFE